LLIFAAFSFEQPYEGSRQDHATLRTFTSRLINRFINQLQLREPQSDNLSSVSIDILAQQEVAILKQLTWFYVIDAPALAMQHEAQKKMIRRLCDVFVAEAQEPKPSGVLPIYYRELLSSGELTGEQRKRTAIDLIASMTESQAISVYQRIEGISLTPGLERVLV
jgi:dGTPase